MRDAASPLCPRDSPSASTTWSAPSAAGVPAKPPHAVAGELFGGSRSSILQPSAYVTRARLCALIPVSTLIASASTPRPHQGPSMSCWLSAERPDHGGVLGRVERQRRRAPAFLSSTIERAGGLARGGPRRGGRRNGRGGVEVHVRVLEQPRAELDAQDPAHGVVDAPDRDPALAEQLPAVIADVGADHLRVGARVQRGRSRARPVGRDAVPAGAVGSSGSTGGHARSSATAV